MFHFNEIVQFSLSRAVRVPSEAIVRSVFYSVEDMMLNLDNKVGGNPVRDSSPLIILSR